MGNKILGDRMRDYEDVASDPILDQFVVVRLDGVAFHTFTREQKLTKPFDPFLHQCMVETTQGLCKSIQNCVLGYTQSDEISLFLLLKRQESQPWFGGIQRKVTSVSASLATNYFTESWLVGTKRLPGVCFDSRIIPLPSLTEVQNYFIWRTLDARRNSISGSAQQHFSHKELQGKSSIEMKRMLVQAHNPWEQQSQRSKFGTFVRKKQLPPSTLHVTRPGGTVDKVIEVMRSEWVDEPWTDELNEIRKIIYEIGTPDEM
jgi:tRNA(His) 5'-end guanylyltransferase